MVVQLRACDLHCHGTHVCSNDEDVCEQPALKKARSMPISCMYDSEKLGAFYSYVFGVASLLVWVLRFAFAFKFIVLHSLFVISLSVLMFCHTA